MNFGRSHSAIAIDAGQASVALCQLAKRRDALRIGRCGVLEDPLRVRLPDNVAGIPAPDRAARLLAEGGFRGRSATLALKPPDVTFHAAPVPDVVREAPRGQWLTMLRFEAARQMQCEPDALEVDFWMLPPGNRSGNHVMIAAARSEAVARWYDFAQSLGLDLKRVDVLPAALLRCGWRAGVPGAAAGQSADDLIWGVLDIGYSGSTLALALGQVCVYARALTLNGDAFTLAICEALQVDYRAAELFKREFRPATPIGERTTAGRFDDLTAVLDAALRPRVRLLAVELERAFSYSMENYPSAVPAGLYVCGGGSRLAGLCAMLKSLLGIVVLPLDPCERMAESRTQSVPPAERPTLVASVGVALGDFT